MRLLGLLAEATWIGRSWVAPCPVPCNYGQGARGQALLPVLPPGTLLSCGVSRNVNVWQRQREQSHLNLFPWKGAWQEPQECSSKQMVPERNWKGWNPPHQCIASGLSRCRKGVAGGYERKAEHQRGASLKVGAVGMGPRFPSGEAPSLPEETSCQVWLSSSLLQVYKWQLSGTDLNSSRLIWNQSICCITDK